MQYIADFEQYARQAGYTQGNAETTDLFLKELPVKTHYLIKSSGQQQGL